jgi:hypothetical protein
MNMTADRWCKVHLALTILWIAALVPTIWLWRESIFWISFMSIYAIIVSHMSAWQAARAERASE